MGNRPLGLRSNQWARRQPEQRKISSGRVAGARTNWASRSQYLELIPGQAASRQNRIPARTATIHRLCLDEQGPLSPTLGLVRAIGFTKRREVGDSSWLNAVCTEKPLLFDRFVKFDVQVESPEFDIEGATSSFRT